jgi:ABC-type phosphate/phosphonate transport system substrate-binding protein
VTRGLLVGATAADPANAVVIWNAIRRWFVEHGTPFEYALYSTYDAMGEALLSGGIDIAWNAPMAHVQCLARSGGRCRTLAMRDTDAGTHTVVVARADAGIADLDDLRGRRLALGVETSSELYLIPVSQLRQDGLDPTTECQLVELEAREYSDLKRWVDDRTIFDAVIDGDAEAGAVFEPWLAHLVRRRELSPDDVVEVWRSRPFSHCAFTAGPDLDPGVADRFVETLLAMDPSDPGVADMMRREHLGRWVAADDSGWADLAAATEQAGLIGEIF